MLNVADDIEINRCFLNGIQREILIEPESLKSILFITEKPWRNRRFSIENRITVSPCRDFTKFISNKIFTIDVNDIFLTFSPN